MTDPIRAPFPYFGGKSRAAALVWERFGDPLNYVEPFAGSLAVLLGRPSAGQTETVNDIDGLVTNAWRAIQYAPEETAQWCDWPVSELDLHARHRWLVTTGRALIEPMRADPDLFDARVAGWWIWGLCQWIGSGWCRESEREFERHQSARDALTGGGASGKGVHAARLANKRPSLGHDGRGVTKLSLSQQIVRLGAGGSGGHRSHLPPDGRSRQSPYLSEGGIGVHSRRWGSQLEAITEWFLRLSARLRRVRIVCGDWDRVVTPAITTGIGLTAVFLDPPYAHGERAGGLYAHDHDISSEVRAWAIAHGRDPLLRICLAGYEGEHAMPPEWECVAWKAAGGYAGQRKDAENVNAHRERLWFSPHCLKPAVVRQLTMDEVMEQEDI